MEVILTQNSSSGKAGQVVKVKDGFARNFLFPNKLAVPVTPENLQKLERERALKQVELAKALQAANELKAKIAALSVTIPVLVQEGDKFYGSIGTQEISKALKDEGLEIDKMLIQLDEPLKKLGIYEVPVRLHSEVIAPVKIWIVKK